MKVIMRSTQLQFESKQTIHLFDTCTATIPVGYVGDASTKNLVNGNRYFAAIKVYSGSYGEYFMYINEVRTYFDQNSNAVVTGAGSIAQIGGVANASVDVLYIDVTDNSELETYLSGKTYEEIMEIVGS